MENEVVLQRVNEERNILQAMKQWKVNWIDHTLRRNCLLEHVIEGKVEGRIEATGTRGRRRNEIPDDFKETTGQGKLKEEALDRTGLSTGFRNGYGKTT